jgi:hypothetical protein
MDQFYRQVLTFQGRVKDAMDQPSSPAGLALRQAVQKLEDDVQVRKNVHSIDHQLKRVIHALEHAGSEEAMSWNDVNHFVETCEHFRHTVKKIK